MSDSELETLFRSWWSASYSAAPPGPHALITHIGWGRWLLEQRREPAGGVTLAEAREAARQLGGGCAEIVHRYLGQQ